MTARDRLDRALLDMAARGQRPPCGQPWGDGLWTSESHEDRARAAVLCRPCPLLEPCAATAEEADERHNVWGGRDWTRHHGPKKNPTKKEQHMSDTEPRGVGRLAAAFDAEMEQKNSTTGDADRAQLEHDTGRELSRRAALTKETNR